MEALGLQDYGLDVPIRSTDLRCASGPDPNAAVRIRDQARLDHGGDQAKVFRWERELLPGNGQVGIG